MLLPEHKEFHEMGPKDLGFRTKEESVMSVDIARTTNQTGEQIHVSVPVYKDEDRETVQRRLGFAFSLIQDRLKDENKAIMYLNEWHSKKRQAQVELQKSEDSYGKEIKAVEKREQKNSIPKEEADKIKESLKVKFEEKKAALEAEIAESQSKLDEVL